MESFEFFFLVERVGGEGGAAKRGVPGRSWWMEEAAEAGGGERSLEAARVTRLRGVEVEESDMLSRWVGGCWRMGGREEEEEEGR